MGLFRLIQQYVNPETIAACGHDTFSKGVVTVQGVRLTLRLPRNSCGYQDYFLIARQSGRSCAFNAAV